MYILGKLKEHGWLWVMRRTVREFASPTTLVGKRLKAWSSVIYLLINKPINFVCTLVSSSSKLKDSLYFFYDFEVEPITYDFAWSLCIANARREELGLSYLRIVFVPGTEQGLRKESAEYEQLVGHDARSWRIYSMLLPVIKLLPCPSSILFCATRNEAVLIRERQARFVYPEKYNVTFPVPSAPEKAIYYQQKIMSLRADNQALQYVSGWLSQHAPAKKVIVITLRQYTYTPERNSNLKAWAQFANELDKEKFFITFVPDTEQALSEIPDELKNYQLFYPACWNLNMRAALYELAYLNLGVNNGPMALCWLNPRCRYITFKLNVKNLVQAPIEGLIDRGIVPNETPCFTNAFQKWIWADDDFDVILREFWTMCNFLKGVV